MYGSYFKYGLAPSVTIIRSPQRRRKKSKIAYGGFFGEYYLRYFFICFNMWYLNESYLIHLVANDSVVQSVSRTRWSVMS